MTPPKTTEEIEFGEPQYVIFKPDIMTTAVSIEHFLEMRGYYHDAFIAERAEAERLRLESDGRLRALLDKSDELKAEWTRAESAESEISRLKAENELLKSTRVGSIQEHQKIIATLHSKLKTAVEALHSIKQLAEEHELAESNLARILAIAREASTQLKEGEK